MILKVLEDAELAGRETEARGVATLPTFALLTLPPEMTAFPTVETC